MYTYLDIIPLDLYKELTKYIEEDEVILEIPKYLDYDNDYNSSTYSDLVMSIHIKYKDTEKYTEKYTEGINTVLIHGFELYPSFISTTNIADLLINKFMYIESPIYYHSHKKIIIIERYFEHSSDISNRMKTRIIMNNGEFTLNLSPKKSRLLFLKLYRVIEACRNNKLCRYY